VATEATRLADPSSPTNFAAVVAPNRDGQVGVFPHEVQLSWSYLNSLGGVPERDDVRFNVAIIEAAIPADNAGPSTNDFPSIEETQNSGAAHVGGGVFSNGRALILRDVSFAGHVRWTDPAPTTTPREYRVAFPALNGKRYLVRVLAVRHTFDQNIQNYSSMEHVFFLDIR
jgi:hypothetical protein